MALEVLDNTGGMYRLGTAVPADPTSFNDYVDHATYQAWTPKGSIHVQVSRDTFVYVSAPRGFKIGGFNQFNPTAPEPERSFNPEFAWSLKAG